MEVTLGEAGLTKTWKNEFPKETVCCRCGKTARIGFVAHEGMTDSHTGIRERLELKDCVCNLHENGGRGDYWLHDCACFAIYICKNCLEGTVLLNQA